MCGKNVLITGASGFLGTYVKESSKVKGSVIYTLGRRIQKDVKEHIHWETSKLPKLKDLCYEKIIHIAGKAHSIPKSEEEIQKFYDVNFLGTKNLLAAIDTLNKKPKCFIFISTVAVYGLYKGEGINESIEKNPVTPYGTSKLKAESLIQDWCSKNECHAIIFRLPLIAGENPPGNLGVMKKTIKQNRYPQIKDNQSRKSIVLASDVADLITNHSFKESGIYNLTDGIHPSFEEIEEAIVRRLNTSIKIVIPKFAISVIAKLGDILESVFKKNMPISTLKLQKMTSSLTFDDTKARKELGWKPNPVLPFIEKEL
jgi:nucleoside-diphosphate-sugar epimerase